jgi:hypothetical protein
LESFKGGHNNSLFPFLPFPLTATTISPVRISRVLISQKFKKSLIFFPHCLSLYHLAFSRHLTQLPEKKAMLNPHLSFQGLHYCAIVLKMEEEKMDDELESAAINGDLSKVQSLLREGRASITAVEKGGWSLLYIAAWHGRLAMMQWLLTDGGAKISERHLSGRTALLLSALCNRF